MRLVSKNLAAAFVGALALVALSAASHANSITSVFSTGVDGSGNVVAGPDQHYTSTAPTDPYYNPAYIANSADSQWIGSDNAFPSGGPVDYTVHFTLTEVGNAILTGSWGVDNQGLDILINGQSLGISLLGVVVDNFNQLHTFTTTAAQSALFVLGDNTLTFRVQNDGGPGAIRTADLSVATTPIPGAILLFLSALGGMGFLGYRKRAASQA